MIDYKEKGIGLHQEIADAGFSLVQSNGVWVADNESEVQLIIDSYPIENAKKIVNDEIDLHAKKLRDGIVSYISSAEMASWPIKRTEATDYSKSHSEADAPMLLIEAQARGITLDVLVEKVLSKATALSQLEAEISGACGAHNDAIKSASTFEDVLSYDWRSGWPL